MAYPAGWPPRACSSRRPVRFFVTGTTTAAWDANAWLFGSDAAGQPAASANVEPLPFVAPGAEQQTVNVPPTPWGGGRNIHDLAEVPLRFAGTIVITNESATATDTIEFTFDGTNIHGEVKGGETRKYRDRNEAGIAVRTKTASGHCAFRIEAW